jgi:hypothetical protein
VALGLTFDLTVTAAAITYFLAVRTGALPRMSLVPVLAIGIWIAHLALPDGHRNALRIVTYGWMGLEVTLLGLLVVKARQLIHSFAQSRRAGQTIPVSLENGITSAVGTSWATLAFAHELTILYYAISGLWRSAVTSRLSDRDIQTWRAIVFAVGLLVLGEGFAVHILLRVWSPLAATIVSVLHAYSLLWFVGDYQAIRDNPHALTAAGIRIACGVRAALDVPRENVSSVEIHNGAAPEDGEYLRAHALHEPNLIVTLHTQQTARLLFGRKKACKQVGIAVQNPIEVQAALRDHLVA